MQSRTHPLNSRSFAIRILAFHSRILIMCYHLSFPACHLLPVFWWSIPRINLLSPKTSLPPSPHFKMSLFGFVFDFISTIVLYMQQTKIASPHSCISFLCLIHLWSQNLVNLASFISSPLFLSIIYSLCIALPQPLFCHHNHYMLPCVVHHDNNIDPAHYLCSPRSFGTHLISFGNRYYMSIPLACVTAKREEGT